MLIFGGFIVLVLLLLGVPAIFYLLNHEPRKVIYLSPEALEDKHREIESIRIDAIQRSDNQEDVDKANESCDKLYKLFKLKKEAH